MDRAAPHDSEHATRRYAASLPWVARRALGSDERPALRRKLWLFARRAVVRTAVLAVAVGSTALVIDARVPTLAQPLGGSFGLVLALLGLVGVLAWAIAARSLLVRAGLVLAAIGTCAGTLLAPDALATPWLRTPWALVVLIGCGALALAAWQRGRMLLRMPKILADLRAGDLDVFEGPGVPGNHALRHVLGQVPPCRNVRLEVLPRAQLVVGVDHAWTAAWQLAHVAEIAAARPHAYRTALPAGVVPAVPDARIELRRRSLSPDERAEISDHVRRLRRAAWPALAATLAVVVVLGVRMSMTADWHNLVDAVALGWYTLAAIAYVGYARRIAAARKLESDRDLRWVVTVEDPQRAPERSDVPRLEVLPVSHLAWTENASPAAWRLCRL
jgi:hypothetical protein